MQDYQNSPIYTTAKTYLEKKMSIIPVGKDKRPLVAWAEYQNRIATIQELDKWFTDFEYINIAIVTGKISGYTVVDVENGGKYDDLPPTLTSKTGGGGVHLFYKYCEGIKNLVRVREFMDIRNDGGYVIVPPSTTDKGTYEWKSFISIADFPKDKFEIKEKSKPFVRTQDLPEYLGSSEGGRNDSITKYAGSLLPLIHPLDWENLAWPMLKSANQKNKPPLLEGELRTIFLSISTREKLNPSFRKQLDVHPIVEIPTTDDEIMLMSEVAARQVVRELETFPTGFEAFDKNMLGGFKEGDLVVITAPTGHGKTTFAQSLTCNIAKTNVPVLFFSFEVMIGNIWKRFEEMGMSKKSVVYSPLKISNGTIEWIEKRILEGIKKYNVRMVVIDHLGFLLPKKQGYDNQMSSNYSAFLGGICRDLKTLAIKNNLVILLLAHVKKTDKPTINDIRDSSGIAQESDYVFILERQLMTQKKGGDMIDMQYSDDTVITLAKNRLTGITPKIKCHIVQAKFVELYSTSAMAETRANKDGKLL
jgi:archaellum biogenesis ATPase FlaH